jgi:hypothetical protein
VTDSKGKVVERGNWGELKKREDGNSAPKKRCPRRIPDPLSPKAEYFITVITVIITTFTDQPGTTGPTYSGTSTNDNLNQK